MTTGGTDTTAKGPSVDRAAAFAAGPPRISRRTLWIALGVFAVLGIGGAFADNSFNVTPAPTPSTVHHSTRQATSLAQFLDLTPVRGRAAPPFVLTTTNGVSRSLASFAGGPIILTFLPAACRESCPVVAGELAQAMRQLVTRPSRPTVLIVNADPQQLAPDAVAASIRGGPLAAIPDVVVLSGPLAEMQQVWRAYGVSIVVAPALRALTYTSVVDLIDGHGRLRYTMSPFANESRTGVATLPASEIARYGDGIASYVERIGS